MKEVHAMKRSEEPNSSQTPESGLLNPHQFPLMDEREAPSVYERERSPESSL